jgi:hypothetical protein
VTIDAELLPVAQVGEMVRALVKATRAFQMYLPNNPMYQRADEALRSALRPVFEELDDVALLIDESRMVWEEVVVYDHEPKSESFAWDLYKDGLRILVLKRGVEQEIATFLKVVSEARLLPVDRSDDLLTLLWQQEFQCIDYRFAEIVSDPWVYDPQALTLQAHPPSEASILSGIKEEVESAPRPEGMVKLDEFDSTLYFLEESEVATLAEEVEKEYARDVETLVLLSLFDVFELIPEADTRDEILDVLDVVFPHLLGQGAFPKVATALREIRTIQGRLGNFDPRACEKLKVFVGRLSRPETISEILRSLDAAEELPRGEDLGEVLRELDAPALQVLLEHLPRLTSDQVKDIVREAARRLATAHNDTLVHLLKTLPREALPAAIELMGDLGLRAGIPLLGDLIKHVDEQIRLAATQALGKIATPGALAALEPALDDEEKSVRGAAVSIVEKRRYVGALRRLEQAVRGKGPVALERAERRQVFEAFAQIAGATGVSVLETVMRGQGLFRRKSTTDTRTCVAYALGRIRTAEAKDLLRELARDKVLPVRHAAASILRDWPDD